MATRKRSSGLTRSALLKFVAHLDPDVLEAEQKYEQLHRRLVKYFELNGCVDPEQVADETIDRAIRKIAEGATVSNITGFVFGIARWVLREYLKVAAQTVPLTVDVAVEPRNPDDLEQRVQCLEQCLKKLKPEQRQLFLQYYGEGDRAELAANMGATRNALAIKVFNIKNKLQRCVASCLEQAGI